MHLTSNIAYALMVIPVFLMLPMLILQATNEIYRALLFYSIVFFASTMSVVVFYLCAEHRATGSVRKHLKYLPCLMSLGIGMSLNNARAVFEGKTIGAAERLRFTSATVTEIGQTGDWYQINVEALFTYTETK